ncbi:MAG: hypothetical protein KJ720_10560 [Proteobacteria bacterium]|nr:hypothetical protein [Pseudomonadota bacterium]MBU1451899.1 hypothetical protein [Pseudomonadota bacterium]MBU2469853.1 hypothetical protein [Pseudomonadota bacterium]
MGKDRYKRRNRRFLKVFHDMLDSPAWFAISNAARVAYLHLAADYDGSPGKEARLRLPYSQAEKLMTRKTFAKALRELQAKGFIQRTKAGGLYNNCSEYALAQEYKSWKPDEQKNGQG